MIVGSLLGGLFVITLAFILFWLRRRRRRAAERHILLIDDPAREYFFPIFAFHTIYFANRRRSLAWRNSNQPG